MHFNNLKKILTNEEETILFLLENNIIQENLVCACGANLEINVKEKKYICHKRYCRKKYSIFVNTFFYGKKIKINEIIHLGFM